MEFENTIRKIIEKECEDYFLGVADLSSAEDGILKQYESFFDEYPRAISIGITLPYKNTDELIGKNTKVYNEINQQLNSITVHLSSLLQQEGYKTLSVPKTEKLDDGSFISLHKLAANLANLGEIEKNGLLVTPEVGTRVNWGTILTDAPIEAANQ
ncbi:4Fe-4S ferredoxin [Methanobacterium sp.]|uniref:4Fe-4S ferredoxin n=1 Tax=Methanobacterium sp. TaxID=2164 RepID=UPI003C77827C